MQRELVKRIRDALDQIDDEVRYRCSSQDVDDQPTPAYLALQYATVLKICESLGESMCLLEKSGILHKIVKLTRFICDHHTVAEHRFSGMDYSKGIDRTAKELPISQAFLKGITTTLCDICACMTSAIHIKLWELYFAILLDTINNLDGLFPYYRLSMVKEELSNQLASVQGALQTEVFVKRVKVYDQETFGLAAHHKCMVHWIDKLRKNVEHFEVSKS